MRSNRSGAALLLLALLCAGCSSIEKVTHYRARQPAGDLGWTLRSTGVQDTPLSKSGLPPKLIYRRKWRWFRTDLYQYAVIHFDTYGNRTYAVGPLLLPVIPNVFGIAGPEQKLDRDANLAFRLAYASDPDLDDTAAQLPVLEIITDRGVLLRPRVEEVGGAGRHFTYDVKIRDLPWFTLREASIRLADGRTLKIPETRFELGKTVAVNLWIPIAP